MIRLLKSAFLLCGALTPLSAASWSWEWKPDTNEQVKAEVCTFKYGKDWAYAVEIDDSPKWAHTFAVPYLAGFHWTDAPPGISGGTQKPFVGGLAAIVRTLGSNDTCVNADDINDMVKSGWGILNHSWAHDGYGWDPAGAMSDEQIKNDAYWSQTILAHALSNGRGPTGAVYANGYTDYNRHDALGAVGIGIATRVNGTSPTEVTNPKLNLMDFNRNYLDEGAWLAWNKGATMDGIPDAEGNGPAPHNFIIDFTHNIERDPNSANQKRWHDRLSTIVQKWGAGGRDNLWCAPTDEVANYVRASKAAQITLTVGKVTVTFPDTLPGTALTLRLTGINAKNLTPPTQGVLYRKDDIVWLTTPVMGVPGAPPPSPAVQCVYEGPPGDIKFDHPQVVAGILINVSGDLPPGFKFRLALHTTGGDREIPVKPAKGGWVVGTDLYPLIPTAPAVTATGIFIENAPSNKLVRVWALGG